MKNILIIEGRRTIGGGQVMTRHICSALKSIFNIHVFIPDGDSDISKFLFEFSQHKYSMFEYGRGKKSILDLIKFLYNLINGIISLVKCIQRNNISFLYVQTSSLVPLTVIVSKFLNLNVICHLHVYHTDIKSRKLLNFFLSFSNVKTIVGVSNYTLSQLSEVNKNKSVVICNCVDLGEVNQKLSNTEDFSISILADVVENKGQHVVVEAIDKINIPIRLNIIGNIVDEKYLKRIKSIPSKHKVNIVGKVSNVNEWLNKTDIVIIPSIQLFETFSLSMVEAWSKGIPTIASNIGGMKELVEKFLPQYKKIMLFEAGNSYKLREKIMTLISEQELRTDISNDIKNVYDENFTKEYFYEQIRNLFCNMLVDF